jgi:phosphotriesterase-related protein
MGWELDKHVAKIVFAKENGILDNILISHDAGWYDPGKEKQNIKAFTNIFRKLYPELKSRGFTEEELNRLVSLNPANAYGISIRSIR